MGVVGLRQVGAQVRVGGAVVLVGRLASSRRHLDDARLVDDAGAAVALLHDSDDPRAVRGAARHRVVALHLRTKLGCLLPGKTHQKSTWRGGDNAWLACIYRLKTSAQPRESPTGGLGRSALKQAEQVPSRFADGAHLGDDRQVVDNEGHLVFLLRRQVVGVSQQTEARHVRGGVSLVLVHQACRCREHRTTMSQIRFFFFKEPGFKYSRLIRFYKFYQIKCHMDSAITPQRILGKL